MSDLCFYRHRYEVWVACIDPPLNLYTSNVFNGEGGRK